MAMQKMSNEKALSFIDTLLGKVQIEKTASTIDAQTVKGPEGLGLKGGEAAGTTKATETKPAEKVPPEDLKTEKKMTEGATGKEKSGDVAAGAGGVKAEDAGATNTKDKTPAEAKSSFNAEDADQLTGGKAGKSASAAIHQSKVAEEQLMKNEMARAQRLSNAILTKVAELQKAAAEQAKVACEKPVVTEANPMPAHAQAAPEGGAPAHDAKVQPGNIEKTEAEQAPSIDEMMKQAADEAYHDFVVSYQYGLLKRAEDEAALQQAMGISPEESRALLDQVAQSNPEAVMPGEAGEAAPEAAAEAGAPEGVPAEAAQEAAGEGESAKLEQAEQVIQQLKEMGISDEEIMAAIQEVDQEGAGGEKAEQAAAAPEAAPEEVKQASEEELRKLAFERHDLIKSVVREFRTAK